MMPEGIKTYVAQLRAKDAAMKFASQRAEAAYQEYVDGESALLEAWFWAELAANEHFIRQTSHLVDQWGMKEYLHYAPLLCKLREEAKSKLRPAEVVQFRPAALAA